MEVKRGQDKGQKRHDKMKKKIKGTKSRREDRESRRIVGKSSYLGTLVQKLLSQKEAVFTNKDDRVKCKLFGFTRHYIITISKDAIAATLQFLRLKRETQLKIVQEIKKVQLDGAEQMNSLQNEIKL